MKKLIQKSIWLLALLLVITACYDDDETLPNFTYEADTAEDFGNLTTEEFSEIVAPFDALFGASSGNRVEAFTQDEIIELIEEFLDGASVLEVHETEARGFAVWKFEISLESGAYLELTLVPELSKVLKVEGKRGPYDYNIDFGEGFVSLEDVIDAAQASVEFGEVIRWELELEEENQWEFEVIIKTSAGLWEVELVAEDGSLIVIKEEDEELEDDNELGEEAPNRIQKAVLEMIEGEIIHSEEEKDDGRVHWKVVVLTATEDKVWFLFDEDENLKVIEGEGSGYSFDPGNDLKTLNEMVEILEAELGDLEVLEWSLREVEEDYWKYDFSIETPEGHFYVLTNAETGEIFFAERENDGKHDDREIDLSEEMVAFVNSIVEGDVGEAYRDKYEDREIIVAQVNLPDEVYVFVGFTENLELVWIFGTAEPIGTPVKPGPDYIELGEAVDIAHGQFDGKVVEWKFRASEGQYRIDLKSEAGEVRVWIDGVSGEILETESREDGKKDDELPEDLEILIDSLVGGEVVGFDVSDDGAAYYIKVILNEGLIKIKVNSEGDLLEIRGLEGPFDYELQPWVDVVEFSEVLETALNAQDGELKSWTLYVDAAGVWTYEFNFVLDEEEIEIKIDAATGDLKD